VPFYRKFGGMSLPTPGEQSRRGRGKLHRLLPWCLLLFSLLMWLMWLMWPMWPMWLIFFRRHGE
jgi:hypothetical protein